MSRLTVYPSLFRSSSLSSPGWYHLQSLSSDVVLVSPLYVAKPHKHKRENKRSKIEMKVGGHRKLGRPKLRWSDVIRKDKKEKGAKIEEAQDWRTWRLKAQCTDPKKAKE